MDGSCEYIEQRVADSRQGGGPLAWMSAEVLTTIHREITMLRNISQGLGNGLIWLRIERGGGRL